MKLFDSHAHYDDIKFSEDREEIIMKIKESGIEKFVSAGYSLESSIRNLELSKKHEFIYTISGISPNDIPEMKAEIDEEVDKIKEIAKENKVVAIGEIGLDYYWMSDAKEVQEKVFRRQIAIAKEHNLPITIHNRDATEDTYKILKEEGIPKAGGIMHSFGGNAEEAEQFLDLGMHISFSGVLTFKKAHEVREAALVVPEDRLLIETDAPYLAPMPYRGKRNEPAYVYFVAEQMAQVKGWSIEKVAEVTTRNAFKLFRWEPEA